MLAGLLLVLPDTIYWLLVLPTTVLIKLYMILSWEGCSTLSSVVATTCQNSTRDMLTSAKLSVGYLVVGITRELNKEPSLHCSSIYINTRWSVLQQYLLALMSMCPPHVFLLRPLCRIHVPWHHTLNLHCTCVYHVYTIRNSYPLTSSLTLTLL